LQATTTPNQLLAGPIAHNKLMAFFLLWPRGGGGAKQGKGASYYAKRPCVPRLTETNPTPTKPIHPIPIQEGRACVELCGLGTCIRTTSPHTHSQQHQEGEKRRGVMCDRSRFCFVVPTGPFTTPRAGPRACVLYVVRRAPLGKSIVPGRWNRICGIDRLID
jgi:hypothetical protein